LQQGWRVAAGQECLPPATTAHAATLGGGQTRKEVSLIRHCVFVKFRPEIDIPGRAALYANLAELKTRIPGMLGFYSGPNASPEGLAKGFEEGFIADFADVAARDAYLADESHKVIGARLVAAVVGGAAGIFVFDLLL
jgi:hypothetical protein